MVDVKKDTDMNRKNKFRERETEREKMEKRGSRQGVFGNSMFMYDQVTPTHPTVPPWLSVRNSLI